MLVFPPNIAVRIGPGVDLRSTASRRDDEQVRLLVSLLNTNGPSPG